jgi:hypothetical protein
MQYSALVARRAVLLPLETQRRRPSRSPQERQTRRAAAAMNAIIAGMARVWTPDLTNKNAHVKRKEKKQ